MVVRCCWCHHDGDHDGTDDEDEGDQFGTIASFDAQTGVLVITTEADPVTVIVTNDTEIRYDDDAPSPATDDGEFHHGVLEEIELIAPAPTA